MSSMSRCYGAGTQHYAADLNDNEFRLSSFRRGVEKRRPKLTQP